MEKFLQKQDNEINSLQMQDKHRNHAKKFQIVRDITSKFCEVTILQNRDYVYKVHMDGFISQNFDYIFFVILGLEITTFP